MVMGLTTHNDLYKNSLFFLQINTNTFIVGYLIKLYELATCKTIIDIDDVLII